MNEEMVSETNLLAPYFVKEVASEVANHLAQRLSSKDVLKLFQVVFLDVEEAAALLRVKSKTISTWISQGKIPVRYAGGKPLFLLSELLHWTLPEGDKHAAHRLSPVLSSRMIRNRLAANRERRNLDVSQKDR